MDGFSKFHAYMKGWRQGAALHTVDTKFSTHPKYGPVYDQGYADGRQARAKASQHAAKQFNYTPSILRICEGSDDD